MKCKNCGKRIGKKDDFCSHCGMENIMEVENNIKVKQPLQLFKILMIIILIALALANTLMLVYTSIFDINNIVDEIGHNKDLLILNIATFFLPLILAALISVAGWYAVFAFNLLGIILSLLTMIRASKKKKIILKILIIIFIVITIVAIFKNPR